MEIHEQRHGAVTVVKPGGPLRAADAEQFRAFVADVMERSFGRFVIDASAVTLADSRGLEVIAEIAEELAQTGQTLRLCAAGETLREVLELTEIAPQLEHYEDAITAARSFL